MGRQGPHPCPGTNRTHQQSSIGEDWFYTWFLGMVDQWRGMYRRQYGNSTMPAAHFQAGLQQEHLLPPSTFLPNYRGASATN